MDIAFGPVPSRRLGRSLGINNIPPKHCSYSCVYCQVGATPLQEITPRCFMPPALIAEQVSQRLEAVRAHGEAVDYLTFVPDGEPTLDINLASTIEALRPLGVPIAIISNASLISLPTVRETLQLVDWVSLKVDCVDEALWRQINRPHPDLKLSEILEGIAIFARTFQGMLVSETMLLAEFNDGPEVLRPTARFLRNAGIHRAYLSIPHRPPAVRDVRVPDETAITRAHQIFVETGLETELLSAYEGDSFAFSGDLRRDILAVTAVHPMRASALRSLTEKSGGTMATVQAMVAAGELKAVEYAGETFYVRRQTAT
ncbi:radical SAM protein [Propionivibrio limicola]|uniref:radical SAM protein n=1 Tax=Propionivibrio limicola TaxID=167645 RepID=UPI001291FC25|nr:radical SAM protein [Propionivibrio limicola]